MKPWIAALAAAAPLALLPLVPTGILPRPLAFALEKGWWLVLLAAAGTAACAFRPWPPVVPRAWDRAYSWLEGRSRKALVLALAAVAFLVASFTLPGWRRVGPAGGDEPKYLRIGRSLYRDLDLDVGANQAGPLRAADLAANLERLGRSSQVAIRALWRGERPPEGHEWPLGNWTVAAWRGGAVHVHGAALPALVALTIPLPGGESPPPTVPRAVYVLLAGLFALAVAQTALLGAEVSGSSVAGLLAATLVATSPAVFVVGYHLYPEAVAAAILPWLARYARPNGPPIGWVRAVFLGLLAGALTWLHLKLLPVALVAAGLLAVRLWRRWGPLAGLVASTGSTLAAFLLLQFSLTGLLRPDGLYVRFASEFWRGTGSALTWTFVAGLGNGLFGARDGLFVMAPVLVAALLAAGLLWRRDPATARILLALVAAQWLSMAVVGGGAHGPPGRLLTPVTGLLAAPLAVGLVELRSRLGFRWSVIGLVLVGLVTTATLSGEPRRTIKPYRRAVTAETDIRRDLPAGHGTPRGALGNLGRAALLLAVIAFWARRMSAERGEGEGPSAPCWREAVSFQAAAWASVAAAAVGLQVITMWTGAG